MADSDLLKIHVQEYYGKDLSSTADLKTSACCSTSMMPDHIKAIVASIHSDVLTKSYGCGSPIPEALSECTVLDLGCGTGTDCFVLSKLVGESGKVIGLDMTREQLAVAQSYVPWHTQLYGYSQPNITFLEGHIEDLAASGIEDNSIDVVVSNCVINLSPNKNAVLSEIFRVLKPGGELYFSDVYSSQRISEELRYDKVLYGECLSGALYHEDFRRIMTNLGCPDIRVIEESVIELKDPEVRQKLEGITFQSITLRAFKLQNLEDRPENYGHTATYLGGIEHYPDDFRLDQSFQFPKDTPVPVCGNTARILTASRFSQFFNVEGDYTTHRGLFKSSGDVRKNAGCCTPTQKTGCC